MSGCCDLTSCALGLGPASWLVIIILFSFIGVATIFVVASLAVDFLMFVSLRFVTMIATIIAVLCVAVGSERERVLAS